MVLIDHSASEPVPYYFLSMKKIYVLLPLLMLFLGLPFSELQAQCMAEAGTITVNDDGGGTNPFVVCFGEDIDVPSDGNFPLPPTGPAPDMVYLFYSCPPTGPDPEADPCWTSWFWTGNDIQTTNDGGIVNSVGINTFILVPTVIDNNQAPPAGPNIDSDGDMCWDINPDDTETFTFLNEIIITELDVDDCAGEVTLQITGGYPEFFPDTYSVSNTGAGSISQSGPDGGTITISGLMDGDNCNIVFCDTDASNLGDVTLSTCDCSGGSIMLSLSTPFSKQFTYPLVGLGTTAVSPTGVSELCLAGSTIGRYSKDAGGISTSGSFSVDLLNANSAPGGGVPTIGGSLCRGNTWRFQFWHRDGMNPSRFSKGASGTIN